MIPSMEMNIWWQYLVCVIAFIAGVFFLVKGSDLMVGGASSLAKKLKVSPLVIGLTVVALGTSFPELAVSVSDSINCLIKGGNAEIALGNVVGSNIANILLVLGISALFTPIFIKRNVLKKQMPILILVSVLFAVFGLCFSLNGQYQIVWFEGLILFVLGIAYVIYVVIDAKKHKDQMEKEEGVEEIEEFPLGKSILFTILGLVGVALGGELTVYGSKSIAIGIGTSAGLDANLVTSLVGLTVVAVGTSLPELVTSAVAAKKGQNDMAVGNVIGSNIFNIVLIIGVASMINPLSSGSQFFTDVIVMVGATTLLLIFAFVGKINRYSGILFLVFYASYITYLVVRTLQA